MCGAMAENASNTSCGWNRPSAAPKPPPKKPGALKGALAGVLIVAVLGAVCWMMFSGNDAAKPSRAKPAKVAKSAKPAKAAKDAKSAKGGERKFDKPKTVDDALANLETIKMPEVPKAKKPVIIDPYPGERTFKTCFEQQMSWMVSTMPGDLPMPIPPLNDEDRKNIVSILISKSDIKETDSEMDAFCKEQVNRAKKEMMTFIKEGGDPDDFLKYYYQQLKSCYDLRQMAVEQAQELWDEDPEMGAAFIDKVNKKFEDDGSGIRKLSKEMFE